MSVRLIVFLTQRWVEFPEQTAFHYKDQGEWFALSYAALLAQVSAYGERLTALGGVPCVIDGHLPEEELPQQVDLLQPRLMIGGASLKAKLQGEVSLFLTPAMAEHTDMMERPILDSLTDVVDTNVALILLTSGTGGDYRAVCHSHQGLIHQIQRCVKVPVPSVDNEFLDPSRLAPTFMTFTLGLDEKYMITHHIFAMVGISGSIASAFFNRFKATLLNNGLALGVNGNWDLYAGIGGRF